MKALVESNTAQPHAPSSLNYKNIHLEPAGGEKIHFPLAVPFEMWLLNDGYFGRPDKRLAAVQYTKPEKPSLVINGKGVMNEACQKRYAVFLRSYLRNGKSFIESLKAQAPKMMIRAA